MQLVARVDALRTIASIEVDVEPQSRYSLDDWQTFFFRDARIDGALIHHHIAFGDDATHGIARAPKGTQIGTVVTVNGRGHGHDIEIALLDFFKVSGATEAMIFDSILK